MGETVNSHRAFPGLHALIGGGYCYDGVRCGSRTVGCDNYPWNVSTGVGVWCVCDSL